MSSPDALIPIPLATYCAQCERCPRTLRRWAKKLGFPLLKIEGDWFVIPQMAYNWFVEKAERAQGQPYGIAQDTTLGQSTVGEEHKRAPSVRSRRRAA